MKSVNPATGETVASYQEHGSEDVDVLVRRAAERFNTWRRTSFPERADLMRRAADILESRKEEFARLMAVEMGKPVSGGRGEVEKCAWVCRYYADNAERFLADHHIDSGRTKSYVHYEPLGAVLAVMPWNFPFWQVMRFAAPALMAGNTGLLKHASNVTGCALAIEEVFTEAGFPEGCFTTLVIPSSVVASVIEHPGVAAATLTGSDPAGRAVASKAGQMLKKVVLELGGSDPSIVLEDADLDLAATSCATGRLINSGQSCIAAKRFIVHADVYDEWLEKFTERMAATAVTLSTTRPLSGLWREPTCVTSSSIRSNGRSKPAPRCISATTSPKLTGPSTRRPSSRRWDPECPPTAKSSSGRWLW